MPEQRKVVTIVFADVVGSTELAAQRDPEVVRALMSRYFKRVGEITQAYGGTVEKFAGDAAMVVFGVPAVHDDDAERAVRAALEIRDGADELAVRVGVNTGEAVTAVTDDRQFMVSGDAVNVAARLQQGAEPGEVVVGPLTHRLTRGAIEYEDREPIAAKGKGEALAAYRALRPMSVTPVQSRGVPGLHAALVGRDRELRLLLDTFARASEHKSLHLFTISGSAGVGKSRLVSEALIQLGESGARVMRGRCLPYGRGITYWPFMEIVRADTGINLADERGSALLKLDRWLGELLPGDPQRPAIYARLAVMLGLETAGSVMGDTPTESVDGEIAWATRIYMESVARATPLIVVIDDIQWAEPPVLRLIEQLAERAPEVAMLLVCVARPEFLERNSAWSAGMPNATTITLDPLNPTETSTLVSRLLEVDALPDELRRQIIDRSSGTPLFCEEFIHMLIDEKVVVRSGGHWRATAVDEIRVPQGINAVLAARLDLLPEEERTTLQSASVIGERFGRGQVAALTRGTDDDRLLETLRRKGLVAGGDGTNDEYRFRHILIRDAAYGSLPKSRRADLHDAFRAVLERSGDPPQVAEIIAHHAERSFALSVELRLDDQLVQDRARRVGDWMLILAERARMRHEGLTLEGALKSLHEAMDVLPDGGGNATRARVRLLEAQLLVMRADYPQAREAAREAAALGDEAGLLSVVATARLVEAWILHWAMEGSFEEFHQVVASAIEACVKAGDKEAEIEARHVGTTELWARGQLSEYVAVNSDLLRRAQSIGDIAHATAITAELVRAENMRGNDDAAHRYLVEADVLAQRHGYRSVALRVMFDRGIITFKTGDLAAAEKHWRAYEQAASEAGTRQHQVSALRFLGHTLLLAHRPAEAASVFDRALELSRETGERWNRSELAALRARAASDAGDVASADRFIEMALQSLRSEDVTAIAETYVALGVIRAAEGRDEEGETALRRGLEAVADTEYHSVKGMAGLELAKFLASRGRLEEARQVAPNSFALVARVGLHQLDPLVVEVKQALGSVES
ncbi:MAG TPA: adenylate/guanylate cyclase domain-containing protein [Candidatus Dormibacteraeota bacterium]|nr:adenylate/guanylate cyclase domain-containing protein [Candidatus Dormibacteraeota bacterium]